MINIFKRKKFLSLFIIFFLIFIASILIIIKFDKVFSKKMIVFCEAQINKISKNIINEAINDTISSGFNPENLIIIHRNALGKIESMNIDTKKTNILLAEINSKIKSHFINLELGKNNIIEFDKNLITNTRRTFKGNGIVFEVPVGVLTNQTILSNIGPRIPIRIVLSGDLESEVNTKVENYGINNVLLKLYIKVKINEQVILPISSKVIYVETNILILTRMIQGDIPNYYFKWYGKSTKKMI